MTSAPLTPLTIGIVGTGQIGGNLARLFAQAGYDVLISFSRDEQKLQALAQELGPRVRATVPAEAVRAADLVVLAVHFEQMDAAIAQMGDAAGKTLLDTSNPYDIRLPPGTTALQEVQRRLPQARVVKAFNTLAAADLLACAGQQPPIVMPLSGEAEVVRSVVAPLVAAIGYHPLPLGKGTAALQEPNGPLYGRPLTVAEAEARLASRS